MKKQMKVMENIVGRNMASVEHHTTLSGSAWFSTLDLKSSYWQVGIHPQDKEETAFSAGSGLYQFTVMPTGDGITKANMKNMFSLFRGHGGNGKDIWGALDQLEEILSRMKEAKLKLNPKTCLLFQREVEFLGHTVSANGIKTTGTKIRAFRDWPRPRDKHEVQSFLELCTYCWRFVNRFADIAAPLHKLTNLKSQFNWTAECEAAFKRLKNALCSSPILSYPQPSGMFILDTDESNIEIGAVLS